MLSGLLVCALMTAWGAEARAQDLIELYQKAYFNAQARTYFQKHGMRAAPRPVVELPPRSEEHRAWRALLFPEPELPPALPLPAAFRVEAWRPVRRLERFWFERRFPGLRWSYSGNNSRMGLDTSWTRVLRGRLEAAFGPPTQTLIESRRRPGARGAEEYIQFEYWIIANDSIPLLVMDVDGPFDRGLVVATDQRYRNALPDLRVELLRELLKKQFPEPYVDYYFNKDQRQWYRAGFNGARYFQERIAPPDLSRGRPRLDDDQG